MGRAAGRPGHTTRQVQQRSGGGHVSMGSVHHAVQRHRRQGGALRLRRPAALPARLTSCPLKARSWPSTLFCSTWLSSGTCRQTLKAAASSISCGRAAGKGGVGRAHGLRGRHKKGWACNGSTELWGQAAISGSSARTASHGSPSVHAQCTAQHSKAQHTKAQPVSQQGPTCMTRPRLVVPTTNSLRPSGGCFFSSTSSVWWQQGRGRGCFRGRDCSAKRAAWQPSGSHSREAACQQGGSMPAAAWGLPSDATNVTPPAPPAARRSRSGAQWPRTPAAARCRPALLRSAATAGRQGGGRAGEGWHLACAARAA